MPKAVMYGAGNIGRGFIGQLFYESGYEVVFIDVNAEIVDRLNSEREYPVRILSEKSAREIIVRNVRCVNGIELEKVAAEIATADVMATAVGVNILRRIAGPIAEGLKKRWQSDRMDPFNIIICENLLNADHFLAELVKQELDDCQKKCFDSLVGLVEASIGRMVPVMTPSMQEGNILRICVEEYGELPVDRDGFKGEIPRIKNMLPASPFSFYIQRKLFIHNMGHALSAYLGGLKGYKYIWEAMADPFIREAVHGAMRDSAEALSREHGMDINIVLEHVDDLIHRFGNKQLGDTVARVGNDVARKLSPNDRLVGALNLCYAQDINPVQICLGIAAAMKFGSTDGSLKSVREVIADEGPEAVLKNICCLKENTRGYIMVMYFYNLLSSGTCLNEVLCKVKEIRQ